MPIDENTKRKIIDLYFDQRKTIREIAKIVKKSSRDVIAVVREHKQELRLLRMVTHGNNHDDGKKSVNQENEDCKNPPLNTRAYRLFSQGMNPLQIAIQLGVSEPEATKFSRLFEKARNELKGLEDSKQNVIKQLTDRAKRIAYDHKSFIFYLIF